MNLASVIARVRQTPAEQLIQQLSRILPPWLSLVLAVAVAWNLGQIVWLAVPEPATGEVAPPPPAAVPDTPTGAAGGGRSSAADDAEAIAAVHLFGEFNAAVEQAPPEPPPGEELDETKLRLKLLGVLADGRGRGQAVIVNSRNDAAVYRVSDRIEGENASVEGVYEQYVRLSVAGRPERLSLPEATALAAAPAPRRAVSRAQPTPSAAEDLISDLVDASNAGATKLSDLLRPQPVFQDNQLAGYRVYPGRDRQAFARLGLRPGDLVTQVNGAALDDPAAGLQIFRQLEANIPIAVTLERNGQVETLVLDTSALGIDSD